MTAFVEGSPNFKPLIRSESTEKFFFPDFEDNDDENSQIGQVTESKIEACSRFKLEHIKVKKYIKCHSATLNNLNFTEEN